MDGKVTRHVVPVLLFHDVAPDASDRWTVTAQQLAACLDAVVDSGRTPVTASELAIHLRDRDYTGTPRCVMTFDDGFASFRDIALPMLAERRIPSTLYVTTGLVGRPGMMSRTDATDLAGRADVELGAHAVNHRHLDLLSRSDARDEIVGSRDALAEMTGASVASFAYPHGSFTSAIRDLVREAGFANAYAVKNALAHSDDDLFALARLTVCEDTSIEKVRAWLAGLDAPLSWRGERLRTTVFRKVRALRA